MKPLLTLPLALLVATSAFAEDDHQRDKPVPGPNGGRVIEAAGHHAEFFVRPDRKVLITFYNHDMKPQPPAEQQISAIAEAPAGKAKLEFEKTADAFVSTTPLPEGDGYRIVLQIRPDAAAKPQNIRINFDTKVCGECNRAEYACMCSHG